MSEKISLFTEGPSSSIENCRFGTPKQFVTGALSEHAENSSAVTRRPVSLDEYRRLLEANERVEKLRQFGLTDEEIALKLDNEIREIGDSDTDETSTKKARKLVDHSTQARQLSEIDEKIAQYKRHFEQYNECTITDGAIKTPVGEDSSGVDPIYHLAEIWKEIQERGWRETNGEGKRTRRRRKRLEKKQALEQSLDEAVDDCDAPWIGCLTREEMIKLDPLYFSNKLEKERSLQETNKSAKLSHQASIDSRESVPLKEIPIDVIKLYRLNAAQIRELSRFKDYQPGIPSQTLYLKNMSPRVTREDLVSMFSRYEKPNELPITYKLLGGRMKGQAFITFPSVETATSALELVNGYDFRGRHIIIQFGKKTIGDPNADKPN